VTARTIVKRRTAEERRREIVGGAAALFDVTGYDRVSMGDIASAAGIAKATLYHYFTSKDEILYWVHKSFIDQLISRQDGRLATALTPQQQLLEVMADILELMKTHRGHVRVFFEHHRELSDPSRATILARRDLYTEMVQDILRAGMDSGDLRKGDPALAAFAIFGMCNWAYQWYTVEGELQTRQIAYLFWDYIIHGLGTQPPDMNPAMHHNTHEGK